MVDPENKGLKDLYDYSDELILKERLEREKKAKEAYKIQRERDLSAKQKAEELQEYAPLANEISNSSTFKKKFCKLYKDRKISTTLEIAEIVGDILASIDLPVAIGGLIVLKITKKIADKYCQDYSD